MCFFYRIFCEAQEDEVVVLRPERSAWPGKDLAGGRQLAKKKSLNITAVLFNNLPILLRGIAKLANNNSKSAWTYVSGLIQWETILWLQPF